MCFKKKNDTSCANNKTSKSVNYKVPKFEKLKKEEIPQLFEEFSKRQNQPFKDADIE